MQGVGTRGRDRVRAVVLGHVVSLWSEGAGSAVAWEWGVRTRVGTWAEITVIVVDVWYLLHLVHGVRVVGRFHPERAYAFSL